MCPTQNLLVDVSHSKHVEADVSYSNFFKVDVSHLKHVEADVSHSKLVS